MESWLLWCRTRVGCLHLPKRLLTWCFLRWLLVPWTLQLAGGISVTHTGPPIRVSLANTDVSFSCRIQDLRPEVFIFTVSFFHVDIHGQKSLEKPIDCQHSPGMENQTMDCVVKLSLPNASATGSYYCIVRGQETCQSDGVFILVRDTEYQPPSFKVQEALLLSFTSLLSVLGALGTALLLWRKESHLGLSFLAGWLAGQSGKNLSPPHSGHTLQSTLHLHMEVVMANLAITISSGSHCSSVPYQ
ncbi:NFAT activation molecule 1 isoform X2 [Grammomys surdaster]|uniref:NFAT activation molecule 1 isoform X2 n=1 Tax=Grammomys surdaster TaxID=491861 RepID=UPI00109FCF8A|nr:NFAT activation molecule 1 isoform X2 [Grammomys surdaster]